MEPAKQLMINQITKAIENFGKQVRRDENILIEDKCLQIDVLLDTLKFLENYDENVKILNKYYLNKKWERDR